MPAQSSGALKAIQHDAPDAVQAAANRILEAYRSGTPCKPVRDLLPVCTENLIRFDSMANSASVGSDDCADPPAPGLLGHAVKI